MKRDREASRAARDEAIARVDDAAKQAWKDAADQAIYRTCVERATFIVDAVWVEFQLRHGEFARKGTHELRAMGARMRAAARAGWCEQTKEYRPSDIVHVHRNPRVVWRSLIHQKEAANGRA